MCIRDRARRRIHYLQTTTGPYMKPKAYFIKPLSGFKGDARLFKTEGGPLPTFVVVSATSLMFSGPETFIFHADQDGEVISWSELEGSFKGSLDHQKALE